MEGPHEELGLGVRGKGRLPDPFDALSLLEGDARPLQKKTSQERLGPGMPLFRRALEPEGGLGDVPGNDPSLEVQEPDVELGLGLVGLRGPHQPVAPLLRTVEGLSLVHEEESQLDLGPAVPSFCCRPQPAGGPFLIPGKTPSVEAGHPQVELGGDIACTGGLLDPFEGVDRLLREDPGFKVERSVKALGLDHPLAGGLLDERGPPRQGLGNVPSLEEHESQVVLGLGESLLGRPLEPLGGQGQVLGDALSREVEESQVVLGPGVSPFGGPPDKLGRRYGVEASQRGGRVRLVGFGAEQEADSLPHGHTSSSRKKDRTLPVRMDGRGKREIGDPPPLSVSGGPTFPVQKICHRRPRREGRASVSQGGFAKGRAGRGEWERSGRILRCGGGEGFGPYFLAKGSASILILSFLQSL